VPKRPVLRPLSVAPRSLAGLAALLGIEPAVVPDGAESAVTGVSLDSTAVVAGDLYTALPGARTHGARFAGDAAAAGAVAVLTDDAGAAEARTSGLPVLVVGRPRDVLGRVAAWVYGEPSRDLLMLGVTGTNGKTTTSYLLDAVLGEVFGPAGLIGTVETRVGAERITSVRTTPEATDLQALLAVMRERGVHACAMEVSSHALALGRVDGIVFDVVGFTNLSQDHLDFHEDMGSYLAAKASLFTPLRARRAVVCVDDAGGRRIAGESGVPVTTVTSRTGVDADWRVDSAVSVDDGERTAFDLVSRSGTRHHLVSPLPGDFNIANTALAAVMLLGAGLKPKRIAAGLGEVTGVPGRMERVGGGLPNEPMALVDYAHTPEAVELALRALRPAVRGHLWIVLGAGGDRDRSKRAAMGEVAARLADRVVVTDDNPRSERPQEIRRALLDGAGRVPTAERAEIHEEGDRRSAIRLAVSMADPDDVVLVAGKGHEQGQEVEGIVHPFDDRIELRAALEAVTR